MQGRCACILFSARHLIMGENCILDEEMKEEQFALFKTNFLLTDQQEVI